MKKKLPVGIEEFAEFRKKNYYYVDKTGLIRDLLEMAGEVNLFTRPRRFGKSLNMDMLRCFFEIGSDPALFEGLAVSRERELCAEYEGKFPVISISLKSVYGRNFEEAKAELCKVIAWEALRFDFLSDSEKLTEEEKAAYARLTKVGNTGEALFPMSFDTLTESLASLSYLLRKHYDRKVILLIDEYDVPLAKASQAGYYEEMVPLIRGLLDQVLKTNASLEFAVLTGCLRVAKESIFTGLNNVKMFTLLDSRCEEWFGFTDSEVREMLQYYGRNDFYDVTREWYDGYQIGRISNIYNPWDVINWVNQLCEGWNETPRSFWINTSSNEEVRRFIHLLGDGVTKSQMERLISGETVGKKIEESLTYRNMYDSIDNLWSLLFFTGYLTAAGQPQGDVVSLVIPNTEVRTIFSEELLTLFREETAADYKGTEALCDALEDGDAVLAETILTSFLKRTVGIHDTAVRTEFKENFYHGILLGLLGSRRSWDLLSNRECGDGYCDLSIEWEEKETGILIELKYAEQGRMEEACAAALRQIEERHYDEPLRKDGMSVFLKYGIAFYRKQCRVVLARGAAKSA